MNDTYLVLDRFEAECYVSELKAFLLDEIGTIQWFRQHERLEKLSMQAAKNAASLEDEFVKELLVTHDKVAILIHSLVLTECWKQKVFPVILREMESKFTCFPISFVLHHLVTISGFLETVSFHCDVCENGGDYVIDLVDFCHRQFVTLIDRAANNDVLDLDTNTKRGLPVTEAGSNTEELEMQARKIDFQIEFKSINILCNIVEHLKELSLGIRNRLLCCHDTPMVLVQFLECPPWIRNLSEEEKVRYDGNKWTKVEDRYQIDKTVNKVWIALYQLIQDEENVRKYDLNDFRKARLLKLRPMLHHTALDQMPYLKPLRKTLEELALYTSAFAKKDLIIEQSPVIYEAIHLKWEGQWGTLAKQQLQTVFDYSMQDVQEHAKSSLNKNYMELSKPQYLSRSGAMLCEVYNIDILEDLQCETTKCRMCGKIASKRCSRCRNIWYCDRQCQVDDWPQHKIICIENLTE